MTLPSRHASIALTTPGRGHRLVEHGVPMLHHGRSWLLILLILLEVALVRSGWLSVREAVAIVVAIEGLLTVVAGIQAMQAIRRFRRQRAAGQHWLDAFEAALAVTMPQRLARLITLELRLWLCLIRWLSRRSQLGEHAFSYRTRSSLGALVVLVLVTSPAEILLLELLIPWPWLRWTLLTLSIYALCWVLGLYASLVVLPHAVTDDGLWLRYGLLNEAFIPFAAITAVQVAPRAAPNHHDGLYVDRAERTAFLAVGGRTDVTIILRQPHAFRTAFGYSAPVETIHAAVDHPQRLVNMLQARLTDEPPESATRVMLDASHPRDWAGHEPQVAEG